MTVLIGQSQGTAVNGLSVTGVGDHQHTYSFLSQVEYSASASYLAFQVGSGGLTTNPSPNLSAWTNGGGSHSHSLSGDTETRSTNFTYKVWVRIA